MKVRSFPLPVFALAIGFTLCIAGCGSHVTYMLDADIAVDRGEREEAAHLYEALLAGTEGRRHADYIHEQMARLYAQQAQWDDALRHCQAILDHSDSTYYLQRADNLTLRIHALQEHLAEWQKLVDAGGTTTEDPHTILALGLAYEELGAYEDAIRYLTRYVANCADPAEAAPIQFRIGELYFWRIHDYELGWAAFSVLIEDERYHDTYEAREAKQVLDRAENALNGIRSHKDRIAAYFQERDQKPQAKNTQNRPWDCELPLTQEGAALDYLNIGRVWRNDPLRNIPAAIRIYRELAERFSPEHGVGFFHGNPKPRALFEIGETYREQERYEAALQVYQSLRKSYPKSAWAEESYYGQAQCHEVLLEPIQARKYYELYLKFGQDTRHYSVARERMQRLADQ